MPKPRKFPQCSQQLWKFPYLTFVQFKSVVQIVASEPVRNLGAMFDSQLIMAPHVKSVVKKSSFHLRNIGKARRVLTEDATKTVIQSLVMSRLDYCNALLIGIQQDLIAKLQRLQNSAARIVSRTRKYEHITPVLIKLHWLPIKFCIQFKVLLLVMVLASRASGCLFGHPNP